ncbi:MAG: DUF4870 domain-containing protein [Xenococcaceae cyanobacterium MO_188.B32]|nr:DUF4870 domain-containing protein [Xenococcaceae cyanobacterium MO_188.B32]
MNQIYSLTRKTPSHSILESVVNRKWISAFAHASVFISTLILSIGIPLFIYLDSEDLIVKENTKEAINFHLNLWLYGAAIAFISFLTFGIVGLVLFPIWFLYHWGLSIWAVIYCVKNPERVFHYPLIFRLF